MQHTGLGKRQLDQTERDLPQIAQKLAVNQRGHRDKRARTPPQRPRAPVLHKNGLSGGQETVAVQAFMALSACKHVNCTPDQRDMPPPGDLLAAGTGQKPVSGPQVFHRDKPGCRQNRRTFAQTDWFDRSFVVSNTMRLRFGRVMQQALSLRRAFGEG